MAILDYDDHWRPAHDVVFAIIFGEDYMFVRLAHAATGDVIVLKGKVMTQATLRERSVKLETIRFDAFAELINNRLVTLDMERSKSGKVRLRRRQVFYTCRAISTQNVDDMAYEELQPINVVFVLAEPEYKYAIQEIGLTDLRTHEVYDDLMNMTVVYVKNVIKMHDEPKTDDSVEINSDMYLFARFLAIASQAEADKFVNDFADRELGRELISMYNVAVSDKPRLEELEKSTYFTGRLNEAQLAYERDKAELKGEARGIGIGEQRGLEKGDQKAAKAMYRRGIPILDIASDLGHPEGIIQQWIAQK
ncbi:hypothetical protein FACS1894184_21370 [Clostridia bacterium]|nr:hypothetical protein FACS1894184_21370 [Clostridia bacterium]